VDVDSNAFELQLDKVVESIPVVFFKLLVIEFLCKEVNELNADKVMMTEPMFVHSKLLLSAQVSGVGVESVLHVREWFGRGPDVRFAAPSVGSTHSKAVFEEHGVALGIVKPRTRWKFPWLVTIIVSVLVVEL
jgi:hypothetical protein